MIQQCLLEPVVRVGRLDTQRDFTYVEDTAQAIVLAALAPQAVGKKINVGSGVGRSMASVLAEIQELTGTRHKPIVNDPTRERPCGREPMRLVADADKAAQMLRWKPAVGFREGLEKTIEGIRKRLFGANLLHR
jgi:dTDP-glucose 4,6-dehydratase